jgi:hypothetical protein
MVVVMSSGFIQVNLKKSNGPFIIYDVPDFEAKKHIQMRVFYIMLGIDERFLRMDENANWYSAKVVAPYQVHFRIPCWPFVLYPHPKNAKSEVFWDAFTSQVPSSVKKEMINVHSIFDADNADTISSAVIEERKWTNVVLDFSKVKNVGELTSQALYPDAGPNEKVDFDYIELPVFSADNEHKEVGTEAFVAFKVGVLPPEGEGSRKVGRAAAPKSALAQKKAAAAARKAAASAGTVGMDAEDENL